MNYRKFRNYLTVIANAEEAKQLEQDKDVLAIFEKNSAWAMERLKTAFHDEDHNLQRWLDGKCCMFRPNRRSAPMEINIGRDIEALYGFLCFCYKLNTEQEISDDFRDFLALTITRSCSDAWEEC